MSIAELRSVSSLHDMANILGYSPSGLSYILYKMPDEKKYNVFDIAKKSGGVRTICAPSEKLKLLQGRLGSLIYDCWDEIKQIDEGKGAAAHGFVKGRSSLTNAKRHTHKRYVLNIDLLDFFGHMNFGRIRGFFISDKHFLLSEKASTLIAQIATFQNKLPQGSPCSPVISHLMGGILDNYLISFAKSHGLVYSRYVDDITFSTNEKVLSAEVGGLKSDGSFELSTNFLKIFIKAGYPVNLSKTRLQSKHVRQTCTGSVVNQRVNVSQLYYRRTRAMCDSLYKKGKFYKNTSFYEGKEVRLEEDRLAVIEGRLGYIYSVRSKYRPISIEAPMPFSGIRKQYAKFLFWKYFVGNSKPVLMCEGKTDFVYIKCAITHSPSAHSSLAKITSGIFEHVLQYFHYTDAISKILALNGGTDPLKNFIVNYHEEYQKFGVKSAFPVIILIDNDDGAKKIFSVCKEKKINVTHATSDSFYRIVDNLYLVKTVESSSKDCYSCIEDCFDAKIKSRKLDGKKFNYSNKVDPATEFGKNIFAERIVKAHAKTINYSGFTPLLERIKAAVLDYAVLKAAGKI